MTGNDHLFERSGAFVGQIYLVVVIAWLVGMHVSQAAI
jgi:hypothetical protein